MCDCFRGAAHLARPRGRGSCRAFKPRTPRTPEHVANTRTLALSDVSCTVSLLLSSPRNASGAAAVSVLQLTELQAWIADRAGPSLAPTLGGAS